MLVHKSEQIETFFIDRIGGSAKLAISNRSLCEISTEVMAEKVRSEFSCDEICKDGSLRQAVADNILSSTKVKDEATLAMMNSVIEDSTMSSKNVIFSYHHKIKEPRAVHGGDLELVHLSKILKVPIIIYRHVSNCTEGHMTLYGTDEPGLPMFLLWSSSLTKAAHFLVMIPSRLDVYYTSLDNIRGIVREHPWLFTAKIDQAKLDFQVFNIHADGDCLFYAANIVNVANRGVTTDFLVMLRPQTARISDVAISKIERKLFNEIWSRTPVRDLRSLATSNRHIYGERSVAVLLTINSILYQIGMGFDSPHTVVADLGLGTGVAVFVIKILIATHPDAIGIGTEMDEHCHRVFMHIHKQMRLKGWPCRVSSRRINASKAGPYDGITHVFLYDGSRSKSDALDMEHVNLMGALMNTPSVDVLISTKMQDMQVVQRYAEEDTNVRYLAQ
jgi:hypothetical protein